MALADNKKAHFNYDILEKYEAGIELLGFEVKSIKAGHASLDGSYAIIRGGEIYILGSKVPPYQSANTPKDYDPERLRKLLMTKKQIRELNDKTENSGLTIVPVSMYNKSGKIKVEIALAKGKKKFDKRETIKKRETDREMRRTIKER